jgi:hypothetical protein
LHHNNNGEPRLNTAEIGAEMLVWLQIHKATEKKLIGVGKEVNEYAEARIKDLLAQAKAHTLSA